MTSPPYYALRDYGMEAQIGRETTPKEYISRLTEVFTEVRRVLCPDGTLWLNISDTYAGKGNQGEFIDPKNPNGRNGQAVALNNKVEGCKPKDPYPIELVKQASWRTTKEKSDIMAANGFGKLEYSQTLTLDPHYSYTTVEDPIEGYDRGSYVAIIGYKE